MFKGKTEPEGFVKIQNLLKAIKYRKMWRDIIDYLLDRHGIQRIIGTYELMFILCSFAFVSISMFMRSLFFFTYNIQLFHRIIESNSLTKTLPPQQQNRNSW